MKTKSFKFIVQIEFSEEINDIPEFHQETAEKIADAINHEAQYGMGIAPTDADVWTNIITVTHEANKSVTSKRITS